MAPGPYFNGMVTSAWRTEFDGAAASLNPIARVDAVLIFVAQRQVISGYAVPDGKACAMLQRSRCIYRRTLRQQTDDHRLWWWHYGRALR